LQEDVCFFTAWCHFTAQTFLPVKPGEYSLFAGFVHLGAGLACGFTGMAAGYAIGIVGDAVSSLA
jgi:ATP synthase proteolipid subunit